MRNTEKLRFTLYSLHFSHHFLSLFGRYSSNNPIRELPQAEETTSKMRAAKVGDALIHPARPDAKIIIDRIIGHNFRYRESIHHETGNWRPAPPTEEQPV